jgi:hypothetical protein
MAHNNGQLFQIELEALEALNPDDKANRAL